VECHVWRLIGPFLAVIIQYMHLCVCVCFSLAGYNYLANFFASGLEYWGIHASAISIVPQNKSLVMASGVIYAVHFLCPVYRALPSYLYIYALQSLMTSPGCQTNIQPPIAN
jgi:hypothetical protein